MTPPGTTLRNLRAADESTWAAIFEKCKTKELRTFLPAKFSLRFLGLHRGRAAPVSGRVEGDPFENVLDGLVGLHDGVA